MDGHIIREPALHHQMADINDGFLRRQRVEALDADGGRARRREANGSSDGLG
jgi:hypothetical protein